MINILFIISLHTPINSCALSKLQVHTRFNKVINYEKKKREKKNGKKMRKGAGTKPLWRQSHKTHTRRHDTTWIDDAENFESKYFSYVPSRCWCLVNIVDNKCKRIFRALCVTTRFQRWNEKNTIYIYIYKSVSGRLTCRSCIMYIIVT